MAKLSTPGAPPEARVCYTSFICKHFVSTGFGQSAPFWTISPAGGRLARRSDRNAFDDKPFPRFASPAWPGARMRMDCGGRDAAFASGPMRLRPPTARAKESAVTAGALQMARHPDGAARRSGTTRRSRKPGAQTQAARRSAPSPARARALLWSAAATTPLFLRAMHPTPSPAPAADHPKRRPRRRSDTIPVNTGRARPCGIRSASLR